MEDERICSRAAVGVSQQGQRPKLLFVMYIRRTTYQRMGKLLTIVTQLISLSIKVVSAPIVQLHSISQARLTECGLRGVHFWNKCPAPGEMIKNGCLLIGLFELVTSSFSRTILYLRRCCSGHCSWWSLQRDLMTSGVVGVQCERAGSRMKYIALVDGSVVRAT
jgi:hypothetical protein